MADLIEGEMDSTVGEFWYDDRQRLDDGLARTEDGVAQSIVEARAYVDRALADLDRLPPTPAGDASPPPLATLSSISSVDGPARGPTVGVHHGAASGFDLDRC